VRKFIDIVSGQQSATAKQSSLLTLLEAKAYKDMMAPVISHFQYLNQKYSEQAPDSAELLGPELYYSSQYLGIAEHIQTVTKALKRSDRQTWFVRVARLALIRSAVPKYQDPTLNKMLTKYQADYVRISGGNPDADDVMRLGQHPEDLARKIENLRLFVEHVADTEEAGIQQIQFIDQTPHSLGTQVSQMERQILEKKKRQISLQAGDQILLALPNNWYWFLLPRAHDQSEGSAMGHCGNSTRASTDDRILSLRHYVGKNVKGEQVYEPFATFILAGDGFLTEMKGRLNKKPGELDTDEEQAIIKDAIKELLKHDIIKGVRGGGYLPQHNFDLKDLPEDERTALMIEHPKLMKLTDRYGIYGMDDGLMKTIRYGIMAKGQGWWSRDNLVKADINPEDWQKLVTTYPEVMSPKDMYEHEGLSDRLMDIIWEGVSKYGRQWLATNQVGTFLTADDREKLYAKYPLLEPAPAYINRHGMTEELAKWIFKGVMREGYEWYNREGRFSLDRDLTKEQRSFLFDIAPELMNPLQHYEKYGLNEALIDKIRNGFAAFGWDFIQHPGSDGSWFPLKILTPEERNHLFDEVPELMTQEDYYQKRGLTPEYENYLVALSESQYNPPMPSGMAWKQIESWSRWAAYRQLLAQLSPEDKETLFQDHPEVMTSTEYYERHGLDEHLTNTIVDGVENEGRKWWSDPRNISPDDLSEEDQGKLFADNHQLAPLLYQLEHWGNTESLRHQVSERVYMPRVKGTGWEHVGDNPDEPKLPMPEVEQWVFVPCVWSSVDEYISDLGDDKFKYYADEENVHDLAGDYYDADSMFDHLPEQAQDALRAIAWRYKLEDEDIDPDDEDAVAEYEEENESASDLTDAEIVEILNDHDDENYAALRSASWTGYEYGAENAVYEAKEEALNGMEWENGGHTVFTLWKGSDDNEHIVWDQPVKLVCSAEDICKAVDQAEEDDDGEIEWSKLFNPEEKELQFDEPYNGFQGFDEDAAIDRFFEEWTVDENNLEHCPYHPASMSDAEKLQAISTMREKLGRSHYRDEELESKKWSSEKISEVLQWYIDKYFIPHLKVIR
jgi:hypothetical protein